LLQASIRTAFIRGYIAIDATRQIVGAAPLPRVFT